MKQLSVFLENRPGRLNAMLEALYKQNINILSLSIAETGDYGIVRFIVGEPAKAKEALKAAGLTVKENNVLALEVEDRPGTLYQITETLSQSGVNVQYSYAAYPMHNNNPVLIVKTDDDQKAKAILNAKAAITLIESF